METAAIVERQIVAQSMMTKLMMAVWLLVIVAAAVVDVNCPAIEMNANRTHFSKVY